MWSKLSSQSALHGHRSHWPQSGESEVSGILVPAFDTAFDRGFLDVRLLTGSLFQHSGPGLGQLYRGTLSLMCYC